MAFDIALAERVRAYLDGVANIEERQMFGGLAFLLEGNMAVGVIGDELMVRVGKASHDELVAQPWSRIMDFTGREMKGWLVIGGPGIDDDGDLAAWVERGIDFAATLPAK